MIKRIAIIAMVLAMLLCVPAFAADTQANVVSAANSPIDLGPNDPRATISDAAAPDPCVPLTRSINTSLFSFTADKVYNMLATNGVSGKNFTTASLTNGYLKVSGSGYYTPTPSGGVFFRAGACYYNSSSASFVTYMGQYVEFKNNVSNYGYVSKSSLTSGTTYYGFITNAIQDGKIYLSGTIYLYNSDGK